uniref:Sorting nexin-27 n=1 Tax=Aceria tosichella TaxID=561515 RepID=A0A6G1S901_9ACAR
MMSHHQYQQHQQQKKQQQLPPPEPRVVHIRKTETGFGFNVRGQVNEGGPLKSINGRLYAPLQHVSAVLEGGAAEMAGVIRGDRILEVNGVNVEGATHKTVVDLIKSGNDELTLTVISVSPHEAAKLEPSEEATYYNAYYDYSEKRSLPISIPEYTWVETTHTNNNNGTSSLNKTANNPVYSTVNGQTTNTNISQYHHNHHCNNQYDQYNNHSPGEKFVVFHIYMAGRHLCSRRYREFSQLHSNLKREFPDFNFPKLPGKWPLKLSDQQLDTRRRGLEQYLEKVCAVRVIAESDIMQDFLTDLDDDGQITSATPIDMKVMLPDRSTIVIKTKKNSTTVQVYQQVIQAINLSREAAPYFALFEIVEYYFERMLRPEEFPHNLYIQNYSTATPTCLLLRKWLFTLDREIQLSSIDSLAESFFFHQAVEDINKGQIKPRNKLYELKALQDWNKRRDYLKLARTLDDYSAIHFPHCECRSYRDGHVVPVISIYNIRLIAHVDGMERNNASHVGSVVMQFNWGDIKEFEVDDEAMSFIFNHVTPNKQRTIQLITPYYVFMFDCFQRIKEELTWAENASLSTGVNSNSSVDMVEDVDDIDCGASTVSKSLSSKEISEEEPVDDKLQESATLPQQSPTPPLTERSPSPRTNEIAKQEQHDEPEQRVDADNLEAQQQQHEQPTPTRSPSPTRSIEHTVALTSDS